MRRLEGWVCLPLQLNRRQPVMSRDGHGVAAMVTGPNRIRLRRPHQGLLGLPNLLLESDEDRIWGIYWLTTLPDW